MTIENINWIAQYIEEIETGKTIVPKKVKQLYLGKIKPIVEGKDPKYYLDEEKGNNPIRFAENELKQSKGEWRGKNIKMMLFQKAIIQSIFGILDRETKLRRFKETFIVMGRKNGKSTLMAPIAIWLTLPFEEQGAEIYCCATTLEQAKRVWDECKSMINLNPMLTGNRFANKGNIGKGDYGWVNAPRPEIRNKSTDSKIIALTSNVDALDGLNSSAAIIDEVHMLSRDIYDLIKQSMSARKQPLLLQISTGGFEREGLYDDQYEHARQVLDKTVEDDSFFPCIYELDDEKEMFDEDMWIKANPAIDVIKSREFLRDLVNRMKNDPNLVNTVKTKDFNFKGVKGSAWLTPDVIENDKQYTDEELKKFDNTTVIGGFDLSRTNDVTAWTTLLFDKENQKIIAKTMYWIAGNYLEKQENYSIKVPWRAWIQRGLVRVSGDDVIDYHDITKYVNDEIQTHGYYYQSICYDSYSAQYLVQELMGLGFSKCSNIEKMDGVMYAAPQGAKTLSIPMQQLYADLSSKKIVYQNNPVTKWMLSNVELEEDRNGNYLPKKADDKYGRKIDGVATILDCYVAFCQKKDYYLN